MTRSCKVAGCVRDEHVSKNGKRASGYCAMHEKRKSRNGSPTVQRCCSCGKPFESSEPSEPAMGLGSRLCLRCAANAMRECVCCGESFMPEKGRRHNKRCPECVAKKLARCIECGVTFRKKTYPGGPSYCPKCHR